MRLGDQPDQKVGNGRGEHLRRLLSAKSHRAFQSWGRSLRGRLILGLGLRWMSGQIQVKRFSVSDRTALQPAVIRWPT